MKPEPQVEDSIKKVSEISKETLETNDELKPEEKEDNTRFGDWVIKGRTIDF